VGVANPSYMPGSRHIRCKKSVKLLLGCRGLDNAIMPLYSITTPAAGIFGKARQEVSAAQCWRTGAVPDVDQFEADFVSYLNRLERSASIDPASLGHERKELSHG
jgi:hypothetical protein